MCQEGEKLNPFEERNQTFHNPPYPFNAMSQSLIDAIVGNSKKATRTLYRHLKDTLDPQVS